MTTLFQNIVNEAIQEGGNAIPSAQDVRGDIAGRIANDIIGTLTKIFGCNASPVGSTGKKGPDAYSGDIDILLDLPWEYDKDQKQAVGKTGEIAEWVQQNFPDCEIAVQPGFRQISFGYPYKEDGNEGKIAQVDLMFTTNFEWRKFSMSSPSPKDSGFKGMIRTVLIKQVAKAVPLPNDKDYPEEFYGDDEFGGKYTGKKKAFYRHMWDDERGLVIAYFSNLGKRGMLSDFSADQDRKIGVASALKDGIRMVFGPEVTMEDLYSPETIVAFLFSGRYPYDTPEKLQKIHNGMTYFFLGQKYSKKEKETIDELARQINDGTLSLEEINGIDPILGAFEKLWREYAGEQQGQSQGEPAYSAALNENRRYSLKMRGLIKRMK